MIYDDKARQIYFNAYSGTADVLMSRVQISLNQQKRLLDLAEKISWWRLKKIKRICKKLNSLENRTDDLMEGVDICLNEMRKINGT